MVSITQLKQVMATANLSAEGRGKLEALITDAPAHGVQILQEGHPAAEQLRKSFSMLPDGEFAFLSAQDMAALDGLRKQDSGLVLFTHGTGVSVAPMFLVYNDATDTQALAQEHQRITPPKF